MSEQKAYVTRWINAPYREIKKKKKVSVQTGTKRVEMTKGLFKKETFWEDAPVYETRTQWVGTGEVDATQVDLEEFTRLVEEACDKLYEAGYLVDQVIPISSGVYATRSDASPMGVNGGAGWGWGYGYSVTDKVVIIGRRSSES